MKKYSSKTILSSNSFRATSYARNYKISLDRPEKEGGNETAATPVEYLLTAIGGCVSMTLRVYANNNNWDLGQISVNVCQKSKLTQIGLETTIIEEISFSNEISESQKKELLTVAGECPVVKLLKNNTKIESIIL